MKAFTLVLCATCVALAVGQDGPVVDTQHGKVRGTTGTSREGRMFYQFRGIPYGKAERFQAPVHPDKWSDVKDVTQPATKCIQYNPVAKEIFGEETGCLNVNVYSPKVPKEGEDKILYPVIVYIHPGLNNIGSNEDGEPKFFMDEDVVFVVPNYRLGVFGFLSTNDDKSPGNYGLRDQILALKWVQDNIEKFGGDKARVTIMGSGSGAADAFLHTLSPQSKGLIHGAIQMGGATLSRKSFILNPVKQAKKLGTQVGCPVDTAEALVTCLKGKDAKEILEKMTKLNPKEFNVLEKAWFGPTVDKLLPGQTEADLVVPDNPVKLMRENKYSNKVPLILGGNAKEGVGLIAAAFLKDKELFQKLDQRWTELAPTLFIYKDTATNKDEVSRKIREHYFGDQPITEEKFNELSDIFMDRYMGYGVVVQAKLYSKVAPVYLYLLANTPETTGLKYLGVDKNYGMAHLDDLQYLFKLNLKKFAYPEVTKDHGEYELSKNIVKSIASFVENGKPTKVWGGVPEWEKMEEGTPSKWFTVKDKTTTALGPLPESFNKRIEFWKDLYNNELANEKETPVVDEF